MASQHGSPIHKTNIPPEKELDSPLVWLNLCTWYTLLHIDGNFPIRWSWLARFINFELSSTMCHMEWNVWIPQPHMHTRKSSHIVTQSYNISNFSTALLSPINKTLTLLILIDNENDNCLTCPSPLWFQTPLSRRILIGHIVQNI